MMFCKHIVLIILSCGSFPAWADSFEPLSCGAVAAGASESDEGNIERFATEVPKTAAKFLADNIRKELKAQGADDFNALSVSLDYYAETALPIAQEVTAQFALIARQEGSYVNGIKRYCKEKTSSVGNFFHLAFDAALDDKLKEAAKSVN
ncbi:hypothetical protein [Stenotrophomonas maltophilia]|uniref:hypothetical protein n=1 Tax=Stenotrophomonas maltophilia TaxID=40324 RepID=UPI0015DE067C|nr:hypothetical protein [Stenotrophomonas maltophilia]MBA0446155.1 hypothetical protein [Stenotrophomonas maltophilia]